MAATSLKLPAALKAELDNLARQTGESTHAIMVRALSEHVDAAKRYRGFVDDAMQARLATSLACSSRRYLCCIFFGWPRKCSSNSQMNVPVPVASQ